MNIWSTLEMTCAAMGFGYLDYSDLFDMAEELDCRKLSEPAYEHIVKAFDADFEDYCNKHPMPNECIMPLEFANEN